MASNAKIITVAITTVALSLGSVGIATAAHNAAKPPMNAKQSARETLVATTIGIDVATLETRLRAGDSLATIAGSKTAVLITALVADETIRIDAAVAAGKLTVAQATTAKSKLTDSVTAAVNHKGPLMGGPKGGHMGGRMGDMDARRGPMKGGLAPVIPTT